MPCPGATGCVGLITREPIFTCVASPVYCTFPPENCNAVPGEVRIATNGARRVRHPIQTADR